MGCNSSKDILNQIEKQDKKIRELMKVNQNLQARINELQQVINQRKRSQDSTNELTNLKSTIDTRFTQLEDRVRKIHDDFRLKLFEGVVDNLGENELNIQNIENVENEKIKKVDQSISLISPDKIDNLKDQGPGTKWDELLEDSNAEQQQQQQQQKDQLQHLPHQSAIRNTITDMNRLSKRPSSKDTELKKEESNKEEEKKEHVDKNESPTDRIVGRDKKIVEIHAREEGKGTDQEKNKTKTLKSTELQPGILTHNDIRMSLATESNAELADESKSKKSTLAKPTDLITSGKGKEIYNEVMNKMFKTPSSKRASDADL